MKEAVGETSMTLITIILVGSVVSMIGFLIGFLISNQNKRVSCENAGYSYYNGSCHNDLGVECTVNENDECE